MSSSSIIYLDYNSTSPLDKRVLEAMLPFFTDNFANSGSTHNFGISASNEVKKAREVIAKFFNADSNEIIFTSGATESVNIAIKGVAENYSEKGKHIITVSTEHKAVLDVCKNLETKGFEITYLSVDENGLINLPELQNSIRPDTILVSVMYVNNETGVIQPIKEIVEITAKKGVFFMTDATQAVGKIDIDISDLGVDMLCFSGHKMYAPKGVGGLVINQKYNHLRLSAQTHGGGQEQNIRSGTLNVPGIIALAKSCEIAEAEMKVNEKIISKLRNFLEKELLKIPGTFINGSLIDRLYNTSNICFPGQDANVLIGRMKNIAVSNGSACTSAVVEPSHVLKAMGLDNNNSFASIRFSLGKYNTLEDVEITIKKIKELTQIDTAYA